MSTPQRPLLYSGIYTVLLSIIFVGFSMEKNPMPDILIALPFFVILYFIFLSVGQPTVSDWLRTKMNGNIRNIVVFPLLLTFLYYGYIIANGENPLKGAGFLVPCLLFFPVLAYAARGSENQRIDWLDFMLFFLFFFPVTLVKIEPGSNLPFHGSGFDSVFRIVVILAAVFAFVVVRDFRDVGFYPVFKWKYLFTTIWVWLAFYAFIFMVGYAIDFIKPNSDHDINPDLLEKIARTMLGTFLHVALFEELVFRGLLQNMLGKRIAQSAAWKTFWVWGLVILLVLSLLAGYSLKGNMQWFPALITSLLFAAAFGIEQMKKANMGDYTALAITSVIFGLVHFHAGSIVFVALASIGGWAYGYVYLKTRNVFYAALLHALVNTTPLLFGLDLAK